MRLLVVLLCVVVSLAGQEPIEDRAPFAGKELIYLHGPQAAPAEPAPLLAFLPRNAAGDLAGAKAAWKQWQAFASERGWQVIVPWTANTGPAWTDIGVKALEAVLQDAKKRLRVDEARIYLAGQGDGASQLFYAASRMPDPWAAALAIEGSPNVAIDSNRIFGANTSLVPVLWVVQSSEVRAMAPLRQKLTAAQYNVIPQGGQGFTVRAALDWLSEHTRPLFPQRIDCETGNTAFPQCYWLEVTKFDPALQNDVLPSTRVQPGAGAYLDLGGFGYNPSETGPGVLVGWLPEGYKGPLEIGDRIVSVAGRPVADAQDYIQMMDAMKEEKAAGIVFERKGKRKRLETRILLPQRPEMVTARVQAEHLSQFDEVQIVSRGVAAMRVEVAVPWAPCRITWNGAEAAQVKTGGCWSLAAGAKAIPCE